jgi:hypothetical protein
MTINLQIAVRSGSILEAAIKNHSTVMTVIFANFILQDYSKVLQENDTMA